jgi:2-oxoglutarate ferredoxin oxidoreductase subunit gamma
VLKIPTVDIAKKLGSVKVANIVALSAFAARSQVVSMDTLKRCVEEEFSQKPELIPLNLMAVEAGAKAVA